MLTRQTATDLQALADGRAGIPRYAYIDGLRGWAILLVLLVHCGFGLLAIYSLDRYDLSQGADTVLPGWLRAICDNAGHGVQLFFVVSAMSLTLGAWPKPLELRSYAIRRFLRIAPMFYLALFFYLAWFGFGPRMWARTGIGWPEILVTFTFMHVWFSRAVNSVVPGGWSVGDEACFYLILPFVLALARRSRRMLIALTLGALVFTQLYYNIMLATGRWSGPAVLGFLNQVPVFLLGVCAGVAIKERPPVSLHPAWCVLIFVVMVALIPQLPAGQSLLQSHLRFAILAAILGYLSFRNPSRLFTNPVIVEIGKVSFSLYLVHFIFLRPAYDLAASMVEGRGVLFLALDYFFVFVPSFLVASVSYRVIEAPFIALGRRLSASEGSVVVTEAPSRAAGTL